MTDTPPAGQTFPFDVTFQLSVNLAGTINGTDVDDVVDRITALVERGDLGSFLRSETLLSKLKVTHATDPYAGDPTHS